MFALANAMGQAKWNLYEIADGHSLADFDAVDRASHSVWGSVLDPEGVGRKARANPLC